MSEFFRRIIRVTAWDSPNVLFALAQQARGITPTDEVVTPGVLSWRDLQRRLATWDVIRRTVGLDANFYEGQQLLMYPMTWLDRAEERERVVRCRQAPTESLGIDPAEGGDSTAMAAVNKWGLKELVSKKTPDTSVITTELISFMKRHNVPPERVCIDRGGGGKQHADIIRARGYAIRTVAFGTPIEQELKRGMTRIEDKVEMREERYSYVNVRAEMAGELRELLDPSMNVNGFALPPEYHELRSQLAPIPLGYDGEGRLFLPPKNRKAGQQETSQKTLTELIGHSPDEFDALCLAVRAMLHKSKRNIAGAI